MGNGIVVTGSHGASSTRVPGCSITYDGTGGAAAFYNTMKPRRCTLTATFANGEKLVGVLASPTTLTWTHPDGGDEGMRASKL